jgi:hypothetical protein
MKKLILIILICLYSSLSIGQENIVGEWKFEKAIFYGRTITFDNSELDKENILLSWMEMGGDDINDVELKKQYAMQKQKLYKITKSTLGSNITFENFRQGGATLGYADLKSYQQAEDENEVIFKTISVLFYTSNKNNIRMELVKAGSLNNYDEFKIILKGNTLEIINLEDSMSDEGDLKITYSRK